MSEHMYSLADLKCLLLEISEATNSNTDITIDGKTYKTDTGYAFEGIEIFLDILHRRENNEHN